MSKSIELGHHRILRQGLHHPFSELNSSPRHPMFGAMNLGIPFQNLYHISMSGFNTIYFNLKISAHFSK